MSLSNIVEVVIDRQTKLPTQQGFGTVLIIDENTVQTNRVDTFNEASELLDLGFTTSDLAYKAALKLLSQSPRPPQFKLGRRDASVAQVNTVTITTVLDATTYTVTLNGNPYSYLSDADATDVEIRDGLIAAINGSAEPVTAALLASNTFTITADLAGEGFAISVGTNLSNAATTPNKNIASEFALMQEEDNDFYFVISTSHIEKDILDLAEAIEAVVKLYFYSTDQADSKTLPSTTDTTSIVAQIKDKAYDRTISLWSGDADNYPEAAWVGENAPKDPGSITWKFKSVSGIVPDNLTATEENNLSGNGVTSFGKKTNHYTTVAGLNIFQNGIVSSGEYIDIIHGTDLLQARIQENVYGLLTTEPKVPYTNAGVDAIKAKVLEILRVIGIGNSILKSDPAPTVTAPLVKDILAANRAARFLDDVKFTGEYAGAIHKVRIEGTLTI